MIRALVHLPLAVWAIGVTAIVASLAGCGRAHDARAAAIEPPPPLENSRQLVLVIAEDWSATSATLQRYQRERTDGPWQRTGQSVAVSIGKTGLAWGLGVHGGPLASGPVKHEGDGKAPAGAFALPFAFGYASKEDARSVKLPYVPLSADVFGVDDVKSKHYNQLVWADEIRDKDWDSAETMRRADGLYEWGVFVNHNTAPAIAGAGSCIFLHIWRGPNQPTAGCTAMGREEMISLLAWLDPRARPVLVQLPREEYRRLAKPWSLP
jgi:D-alanyl-D-alanine dipeptidase